MQSNRLYHRCVSEGVEFYFSPSEVVLPIEVLEMVDSPSELMPILVVAVYSRILFYNIRIILLPVFGLAVVFSPSEVVSMVWDVKCLVGEIV